MVKRVPQPRKSSCSPRGRSGCPWVSTGVQAGLPTTAAIQELYWCQQSSRAHQADRMTSARLELQNPQKSLTLLNQLSFTTVKQLQQSTATQSLVAETECQKVHCPEVTRAGKPRGCSSLLNHTQAVIFPTSNCLAKEQEKSNRKQPGKLSSVSLIALMNTRPNEASSWAQTEISPNYPENPAPMGSLSMPVAQHAATSPSSKPNSMEQVADQSNQVITCRSFLWIMYSDCTIAILCIARQWMAAVANNKFHSWYEWVWHRSSMSSIAWARRKSCCRRPGW